MSERDTNSLPNPRARPRPTLSCLECKRKKLKCDREQPCGQCTKSRKVGLCHYAANSEGPEAQQRPTIDESVDAQDDRPSKRPRFDTDLNATEAIRELQGRVSALEQREREGYSRSSRSMILAEHPRTNPQEVDGANGHEPSKREERRLVVKDEGRRTRLETGVKHLLRRDVPRELELLLQVARNDGAFFAEVHQVQAMQKQVFARMYRKGNRMASSTEEPIVTMVDTIPVIEHSGPLLDLYFDHWSTVSGMGIMRRDDMEESWQRCCKESKPEDWGPTAPLLTSIIALAQAYILTQTGIEPHVLDLHVVGGATATDRCELLRRYLATIPRKKVFEIETLQIEVLLLQTEEMLFHPPDLLWQSLGSVLRTAWGIGLHVDVNRHPGFTQRQRENRRRLWQAINDMDTRLSKSCNLPAMLATQGSSGRLNDLEDPYPGSDAPGRVLSDFNAEIERTSKPDSIGKARLHIFLARHRYELMEIIATAYKQGNDYGGNIQRAMLGLASSCGIVGGNIKEILFLAAAQPGLNEASMRAALVSMLSTARNALRAQGFGAESDFSTPVGHIGGSSSDLAFDGFDGALLDFFELDGLGFDGDWPAVEAQNT